MLGDETVEQILRDGAGALSPAAAAMLPILTKLTLAPAELGAADLAPALAAGVTPAAIREAFDVAWAFNIINRMADALGFAIGDRASFDASARFLLSRGYA